MKQFVYKSAAELAAMIRNGEATSTEIVKEHLSQICEYNSKINAIIISFEKEALETAAECDREAKEGKFRGPLHGVPVTIKEAFWVKGVKSTVNSNMHKDFIAPMDAVVVERIRNSGAVILGKTNIPKNLMDHQVWGDIYPEGKNPYDLDYTPGGSTGGGAAALAAGFTTLELGSDIGGSIRVPSAFCGLYGLKPTDKTVPLHGNMPIPKKGKTFLIHMAQAGPLARNAVDLEILWKTIVGPHESDRNIPRIEWKVPTKKSLSEYKIAWTDSWPGFAPSNHVTNAIQKLISSFIENGGIAEKKIPDPTLHEDTLKLYAELFPYVIAQGTPWIVRQLIKMQLRKGFLKGQKKFWPEMKKAFRMNANHYAEVMLHKSKVTRRWEDFFKEYDFIICPVSHGPAFKRCKMGSKLNYEGKELNYIDYSWPYVACFNASGNPVLSFPLGLTEEGLPIGAQIVGPYWSEPDLLNFTKLLSAITPGFIKPEKIFSL